MCISNFAQTTNEIDIAQANKDLIYQSLTAKEDSISKEIALKTDTLKQAQLNILSQQKENKEIEASLCICGIIILCIFFVFFTENPRKNTACFLVVLILSLGIFGVHRRPFHNIKKINQEMENLQNSSKLYNDQQIQIMYAKQKAIQTSIDARSSYIRDSIAHEEQKALNQYIEAHSFSKKMRIIACSWEASPDTPERGSLTGSLTAEGNMGAIIFDGTGGGIGSSSKNGEIIGKYTGRIEGNKFTYFHFILSDNSYHVIDASKDKKWLMAQKGIWVRYDKTYTNYDEYNETFTPLYNESV